MTRTKTQNYAPMYHFELYLTHCSLSGNENISDVGVCALAKALHVNKNLEKLK